MEFIKGDGGKNSVRLSVMLGGEKLKKETRYYISILPGNAKLFGDAVRKHWGIENSLHWVLGVVFREYECRIRKGLPQRIFLYSGILL